jgi:Protein of unknown function (DUF2934)
MLKWEEAGFAPTFIRLWSRPLITSETAIGTMAEHRARGWVVALGRRGITSRRSFEPGRRQRASVASRPRLGTQPAPNPTSAWLAEVRSLYPSLTTLSDKQRVTQQGFSHMNQPLEDRIRERAYEIWTAHGCIDGQADQHWLAAEREILAKATNALVGNSVPQQKEKKNRRPPSRAKTSKTLNAAS